MMPNQPNNRRHKDVKLARFRGWSLTALYFALALWALIFCYATYYFWTYFLGQSDGSLAVVSALMTSSILTFGLSARAGHKFLTAMRTKAILPSVDLLPFLAITITIVIARQAFGAF